MTNQPTKQGTLADLHGDRTEAIRYTEDYGYYMVTCPHCGECNDTEPDGTECNCVTCNKLFKTGLLI